MVRWIGIWIGWVVWVRLWFQGPLSVGPLTIPAPTGLLLGWLLGWVFWVLRTYHVQTHRPPLRLDRWGVSVFTRTLRHPGTVVGILSLVWLWTTVHTLQVQQPRGFVGTYFSDPHRTDDPLLRMVQGNAEVRSEVFPEANPSFAVTWVGFFHVARRHAYRMDVQADDEVQFVIESLHASQLTWRGKGRVVRSSRSLPPGWYRLRLTLINRRGPYHLEWRLCGQRCLKPSDFYPYLDLKALQRERRWFYGWGGLTLVLVGVGLFWGRRYLVTLDPTQRRALLNRWIGVGLPILLGVGIRGFLHPIVPTLFSSDEAVYHSMAIDIVEGRGYNSWKAPPPTHMRPGHPTFEYGQAYGGTLVSHLTALLAVFFGRSWQTLLWAIDLLIVVFLLGLYVWVKALWSEPVARWAMWIAAIPHFQQILLEHVIVRADIMALTPWTLWLLHRLWTSPPEIREQRRYDFWLGFLLGALQWVHPSTVSILATVGLFMLIYLWVCRREGALRHAVYLVLGFSATLMPIILWNMQHDWIILRVPQVIAFTPQWTSLEDWIQVWSTLPQRLHRVWFYLIRDVWGILWIDANPFCRDMLLSCRITSTRVHPSPEPFWATGWMVFLWLAATVVYLIPFLQMSGWNLQRPDHRLKLMQIFPLALLGVTLGMNALAAWVLIDGRYMVHLYAVFPTLLAFSLLHVVHRWAPGAKWIVLALVLTVHTHALSYGYGALRERAFIVQDLVAFLKTHGVRSVITNFETAYWLMWMTDEAIRAAPGYLPPKDRHSLLTQQAFRDPKAGVLLPIQHMEMIRLEEWLQRERIQYRRLRFREWILLLDFSEPYWQRTVRFI